MGKWADGWYVGRQRHVDGSGMWAIVGRLLRGDWAGEDLGCFSGGFGGFVMVFGMTAWTISSLIFFSIIRDWGRSPARGQEYPRHARIWFLTTAIERK